MALIDKETFLTSPENMSGFPYYEKKDVKEAVFDFNLFLRYFYYGELVGIIKLTKKYNFYDRLGSISISEVFKLIFGDFEK
jgi:hypothetical protein